MRGIGTLDNDGGDIVLASIERLARLRCRLNAGQIQWARVTEAPMEGYKWMDPEGFLVQIFVDNVSGLPPDVTAAGMIVGNEKPHVLVIPHPIALALLADARKQTKETKPNDTHSE